MRGISVLCALSLIGAGCAGSPQPKDPCEPTYWEARSGYPDEEREARCAEQQQAETRKLVEASKQPIDHALAACRAGQDSACASHLRDKQVWSQLLHGAAYITNQDVVLESACRGGHEAACSIMEEVEESRAQNDPVATKRVLAAMEELQQLERQWIKQLSTLSHLKCATGEDASIQQEWEKGRAGREVRVEALDAVLAEVKEDAAGLAASWPALRENFDVRVKAAEQLAFSCKLG